jgi:hypothetical protein
VFSKPPRRKLAQERLPSTPSRIVHVPYNIGFGRHLVVLYRLVVFANNVDTEFLTSSDKQSSAAVRKANQTYHDIFALQLVWLALHAFIAKSLAINKGTVGRFDVSDVHLGHIEFSRSSGLASPHGFATYST